MATDVFVHRTRIPASAEEVFRWHEQPDAFKKLIPPWADVRLVKREGGIKDGARTELHVKFGPYRGPWILEHQDYQQGKQFADVQLRGPFSYWKHTHRMEPDGARACYLEDHIQYKLPAGPLGKLIANSFVRNKLKRLFQYRHAVVLADFTNHSHADSAKDE